MGKILEPNIDVENIEIHLDEQNEFAADNVMGEWGFSMPLIKLNDTVLNIGDIEYLNIYVSMFDVPTFSFSVKDYNYRIQESLDNKEDKCVIFVGNKNFYTKFNGIITKINTSNNNTVHISGIFYLKELFEFKQEGFVDTSVVDMLTKVCTDTNLGLFTYENESLEITPEYYLNPNTQQISFLSNILSTFTNNLWAIDTFGFLHVGDLENILNKPVDKYLINPETQKEIEEGPQDILITFNRHQKENIDTSEEDRYKFSINADNITISTDFSMTKVQSAQLSTVYTGLGSGRVIDDNIDIGIENSIETENTFSGFLLDKYPLRNEQINKMLYGNTIKVSLKNYLIEIVPFTLVDLEIYYDQSANIDKTKEDSNYRLDTVHSGKHFVAGYSYHYRKNKKGEPNKIMQELILI